MTKDQTPSPIGPKKKIIWVDSSCDVAVVSLISLKRYHGRVITAENDKLSIEEYIPPNVNILPHLICRSKQNYTERRCRSMCRQIAQLISILHTNRIVHRNLHIKQFVVDENGIISMRGLQHITHLDGAESGFAGVGHPHSWYAFRPPENGQEYNEKSDVWSFGAIIYTLLTGLPPFRGSRQELKDKKNAGIVDFDVVVPSCSAQDLIRKMLAVNPRDRPTIKEVLQHEWMTVPKEVLEHYSLPLTRTLMEDWDRKASPRKPRKICGETPNITNNGCLHTPFALPF